MQGAANEARAQEREREREREREEDKHDGERAPKHEHREKVGWNARLHSGEAPLTPARGVHKSRRRNIQQVFQGKRKKKEAKEMKERRKCNFSSLYLLSPRDTTNDEFFFMKQKK